MSDEPDVLIRALGQRNAHAAQLAMLASVAVQIEPELLRALRLLIPDADAGAEADVWLSDLVESRSTLAITLRPDLRRMLQDQLAPKRETLDAVAAVLARVHADVSDVIRIEEQVTIESLRNEPGARERIDALLAPVVATLEAQRHRGLARWAIRAFDAAPSLAKETRSMWRLMRSSSVMRAAGGAGPATVPVEAALQQLPRRLVRLRLRKDALEVEAARQGRVVVEGSFLDAAWRETVTGILQGHGFELIFLEDIPVPEDRILDEIKQRIRAADGYVYPGTKDSATLYFMAYARGLQLPLLDVTENPAVPARVSAWADGLRRKLLSEPAGVDLEIPDTVPLMLEVAWDDEGRRSRRVTMQPGDTVQVHLRPRSVTVSAFHGEMWAIEPELELEDHAIVIAIEHYERTDMRVPGAEAAAQTFYDWLIAPDGGRLPAANVRGVRSIDQWRAATSWSGTVRRVYVYFAGAAIEYDVDREVLLLDDSWSTAMRAESLQRELEQRAEEVILIVDALTLTRAMKFTPYEPAMAAAPPARRVFVATNSRARQDSEFVGPQLIEGLRGAAADESGRITTRALASFTGNTNAHLTYTEFVLRRNAFTTATFHFPRAMFGAEMQLFAPNGALHTTKIGDSVELTLRPATYELVIAAHAYSRTLTLRPGHNDITIGWRFNGHWVIVAGKSYDRLTEEQSLIGEAVARALADHGFGLFVGSYPGVDELAARVFVERVAFLGGGATEVFRQYVQKSTAPQFKAARTVYVEDDYEAPLAEASALVIIGGDDGTMEYVSRAQRRQVPVFPIAATGDIAAKLAEASAGEFAIDSVTAHDIAQHTVEQIERITVRDTRSSTPGRTPA